MGVLLVRALLFEVSTRAPDFWKPPYGSDSRKSSDRNLLHRTLLPKVEDSCVPPAHASC